MSLDKKTEILVKKSREGGRQQIYDLLAHAWNNVQDPDTLKAIADYLWNEEKHRTRNDIRLSVYTAGLFGRAGQTDKEIDALTELSKLGHAPAMHLLGAHYHQKGDREAALAWFQRSKELRYDVGAWAFHRLKADRSRAPKKWYHLSCAHFWRVSSAWRKSLRNAPDTSSTWEP
ncbi:hypothetical protein [Kordiimonas sp.]|uniref:hypothetical protein n=1 Tax=Kordiimonas sp. TaxID=1970157 RepID=UPI003A9143E7